MAQDYARSFYRSKAWQQCRASFIQSRVATDGGMCQHCGQVPGHIVDHVEEITPDNIGDPWVTLNHDNLQFLCLVCHNIKHYGAPVTREGFRFDSNGQLIWAGGAVSGNDISTARPTAPIGRGAVMPLGTGGGDSFNTQVARVTPLPKKEDN